LVDFRNPIYHAHNSHPSNQHGERVLINRNGSALFAEWNPAICASYTFLTKCRMQKNGLTLTSLCCYTYHDNDNPMAARYVSAFEELHIKSKVNKLRC